MKLPDIYATRRPAISIEFFPPKTAAGEENLAARLQRFRDLDPAFVSITYGAGGSTRSQSVTWARRLRHEFGFEVMFHLTCVGQSRGETAAILDELRASGIENIIALRGDPPHGETEWRPHPDGYHHASELVRDAAAAGCWGIAVAGFPEVHPESPTRELDRQHLAEKVRAGAHAVVTQLFFDNADYFGFVEEARVAGVDVPIVPGILPFRTVPQLRRFTTQLARAQGGPARIPPALEERLAAVETDDDAAAALGIEYASSQCEELLSRGAPGIHFYCLNESNAVERILTHLRGKGLV